jgi:DNA-binding transcriptional MerR regulator
VDKSPDAFRTISEVAETLETPAHVLRFWESRFPQIRPVKRAGGRRYYRPADVALLTGIKHLLHAEGLTIRGVQKILREQGVRHVASLSGQDYIEPAEHEEAALEAALTLNFGPLEGEDALPEKTASATIVTLETSARRQSTAKPVQKSLQPPLPDLFAALPAAEGARESDHPVNQPPLALIDRLRALPAHALAQSDIAAHLLLRLQALHQQIVAGADQAATSR